VQTPLATACRLALLLSAGAIGACHESELEPKTPDGVWEMERPGGSVEATYTLAPVPAVFNPAPLPRERPRSVSLGYIGDAPLTQTQGVTRRWPWVQERFHIADHSSYGYGYGYRGARRR
jgi:hypothetical protein